MTKYGVSINVQYKLWATLALFDSLSLSLSLSLFLSLALSLSFSVSHSLLACLSVCLSVSLSLSLSLPPSLPSLPLFLIPGSNPVCDGIFPGLSHTNDLKIETPVATLPGAWCNRVGAGTGWPSVSILWLDEMESLICNFYLTVAAHKIVWAHPSLKYTCMLLRH